MAQNLKQPKMRDYLWRDLVEKPSGPEPTVVAYEFSNGRKARENPKQPYGKKILGD